MRLSTVGIVPTQWRLAEGGVIADIEKRDKCLPAFDLLSPE